MVVKPESPSRLSASTPDPALRRNLARWYRAQGRHALPWRLTRDPYAVLVSEVMLQQTQVDRVLRHYGRWLARWPTVQSLAAASPADAIREWAGLGYNRRALNLHLAARAVVEDHGGLFPGDERALRALPGVGPYTAAAVVCFAFGRRVPLADTNIARVLARTRLGLASNRGVPASTLQVAAAELLSRRDVRHHNLALMDLGALVCTSRDPACLACPLRRHCAWHADGSPAPRLSAIAGPRFETTARYARGRIIDALRSGESLDEPALASHLPPHHHANLPTYLSALARDGLITATSDGWALPR